MEYYTLDRKNTAKMLNVSTRTLDRYVAKKLFSTKRINGKVYFHKKEIEGYVKNANIESVDISADSQATRLTNMQRHFGQEFVTKNLYNSVSNEVSHARKEQVRESSYEIELREQMYKNMYEAGRQTIEAQQERLQSAYYKIGLLEMKLKNSTPLLESKKQEAEQKAEIEVLKKEQVVAQNHLKEYEKQISQYAFLKTAYTVITISTVFFLSLFFAIS